MCQLFRKFSNGSNYARSIEFRINLLTIRTEEWVTTIKGHFILIKKKNI